jgi:hypothetical protein
LRRENRQNSSGWRHLCGSPYHQHFIQDENVTLSMR